MDIFLLPSKHEGLVAVLLEAQIEGLNCIGSNKVSSEGFFNSNVSVINLEEPPQEWARRITKIKLNDLEQKNKYTENNMS